VSGSYDLPNGLAFERVDVHVRERGGVGWWGVGGEERRKERRKERKKRKEDQPLCVCVCVCVRPA
jgi:hypothetical protein